MSSLKVCPSSSEYSSAVTEGCHLTFVVMLVHLWIGHVYLESHPLFLHILKYISISYFGEPLYQTKNRLLFQLIQIEIYMQTNQHLKNPSSRYLFTSIASKIRPKFCKQAVSKTTFITNRRISEIICFKILWILSRNFRADVVPMCTFLNHRQEGNATIYSSWACLTLKIQELGTIIISNADDSKMK